jgi:membrane protein YdbS with pleckstrin-like domain
VPFPTRLLIEGEEVALDLRPHWWFCVGPVAAGAPVIGLLIYALTLDGDAGQAMLWLSAAVSVVWAVWLAGRLARWTTTHFVVTTERLVFRSGVLSKQGRDIPLDRVNDVASHQSFFERLLGSGDLLIESAGERGQQSFHDIPHPDAVQQEIYRQIELNETRTARKMMPPGMSVGQSVPEQIAALADLRDRGAISEAEFQTKKAELLSRM